MTPHEQTQMAQTVDRYEIKIRALEQENGNLNTQIGECSKFFKKLTDDILEICKGETFESKTCPEAHLQNMICKIIDIATIE